MWSKIDIVGSRTIDLLERPYALVSWIPAVAQRKETWQENLFADARSLTAKAMNSTTDSIEIQIIAKNQDGLARAVQDLGQVLDEAPRFWI